MKRWATGMAIIAAALMLSLWRIDAYAQQETNAIRSQQAPAPAPSIASSNSQATLQLPTSPANPVLEIPGREPQPIDSRVLASAFVGCWQGYVDHFDSLTPIAFLSSALKAAHSTYTLCYLPNADGKTYRLEMRKLVVQEKELQVTAFENQVLWVDDAHRRGYLRNHVTALQTGWLLIIPIRVTEQVYAEEIVETENPDLIHMRGRELIKVAGKDYARTEFHADFQRIDL